MSPDLVNPQRNFDPFAEVSGRYGAPMGRHGHGSYDPAMSALYEAHQGGEGGYDKGGVYWGLPCDVYAVWSGWDEPTGEPEFLIYVRAANPLGAVESAMRHSVTPA